ncbi:MAG: macro domain-containing protein [Desulfurococcales archaeon]|nr:macro domain-containing protein [Desulfurococcales archaeon]
MNNIVCFKLPEKRRLEVREGDITRLEVDAIVNAANSFMWMGGGVAGAIKRRGGEEIEREARRYAPVPIGSAVITSAGRLPARYVIHAPTMERPAMRIPLENAVKATKAALHVASQRDIDSIAFPAMGAGVGGLSVYEVARAMARVVYSYGKGPRRIVFVAYGETAFREMLRGVREELGSEGEVCT